MTQSKLFRAILVAALGAAAMTVNTGAYAHGGYDPWDHRARVHYIHHHPYSRHVVIRERPVFYAPRAVVYERPAYYYANDPAIVVGVRIPPLVIRRW